MENKVMSKEENKVVCWWSGGVTSAVACKLAIDIFGLDNCQFIMIDTENEDIDTYRFKKECEQWYGKEIETITAIGDKYEDIFDVWRTNLSLNIAKGAICSSTLKSDVRVKWQKENKYRHQVFGFEFDRSEFNRARSMLINHPLSKPIFPLMMFGYNKNKCINLLQEAGIEVPRTYSFGFHNNNCFNTGCVQGGIGYWQKMKEDFPEKFKVMADLEHELTDKKGQPVTMLKDQTNKTKQLVKDTGIIWKQFLFLRKHPDYPELMCIDDKKVQKVEPLFECNGFCGVNDLNPRKKSEGDINLTSQ